VFKSSLQPLVNGNYKKILGKSISMGGVKTKPTGFDGIVTVAEYGIESEVIDVTDGKKAYDKKKHHGEKVPYYMRLHIPVGGDQGILLLQRLSKGGINGIIKDIVRDYFVSKFPTFMLDIRPMVPDFVLQKYMSTGTPKAVSFLKHSIPADYADKMSGKKVEQKGSVEVIIRSPVASIFQAGKVSRSISTVGGIKSVYSFDDFEPDKVKMKIDVAGKIRTINLSNHSNLRSSFDITDKVALAATGYPNVKDIASAAQDVLSDIAAAAGIPL
jgi:hypothetical protein